MTHDYHAPFRFTGTIHRVTVDLSGNLIKDDAAEMRVLSGSETRWVDGICPAPSFCFGRSSIWP